MKVRVAPEVLDGLRTFGLPADALAVALETLNLYLSARSENYLTEGRWPKCARDYFVHQHAFIAGDRWQTLEFIVRDSQRGQGLLDVVWVEHHPGAPL
jgi:hypothetical protein